ncbi:hypothetical protein [Gilliamella sp. ESL0254]|uniref:hypothetical protein n=1 Tax=Gilliamella sp. ESL0254 TaxID=2705035 RepID=UPI0015805541|nr:hypothetical protein [Gilliamella sp. ESL0254]NUF27282.1 hypothetical protein [Gilliamella sp. ESL0254]
MNHNYKFTVHAADKGFSTFIQMLFLLFVFIIPTAIFIYLLLTCTSKNWMVPVGICVGYLIITAAAFRLGFYLTVKKQQENLQISIDEHNLTLSSEIRPTTVIPLQRIHIFFIHTLDSIKLDCIRIKLNIENIGNKDTILDFSIEQKPSSSTEIKDNFLAFQQFIDIFYKNVIENKFELIAREVGEPVPDSEKKIYARK